MKSKLGELCRDFFMTTLDFAIQITLNLVLPLPLQVVILNSVVVPATPRSGDVWMVFQL